MLAAADGDDVVIDVCAYHCQQCVEKVIKFLILRQGDEYANDHRSDIYLEDLKDEAAIDLTRQISSKIDSWATTIRYHHTILSNKKMVDEVILTCEKLISRAEKIIPPVKSETD
jgi:HEPN domain-containing protein